jgi:hypothetical protein
MPAVLRLIPMAMSTSISSLRPNVPSLPSNPSFAPLPLAHNTQDSAGSSGRTRRAKRKRFWWCRETPAPPGRHRRHHHRTGADTERPISRCAGGSPATPTLPPHTPCALIAFPDQRRALRPYLRER